MIFWFGFILLVVSIVVMNKVNILKIPDWVSFLLLGYSIIWIGVHMFFGIYFLCEATPKGQEMLRNHYEELINNKDSEYIRPDIITWNEKIKYNKKYQKDFWVGPYIPNVYDQFDVITVEE